MENVDKVFGVTASV